MAAFTDRMRVFISGNLSGGKMKDKIDINAAVAWKRHGGFEKEVRLGVLKDEAGLKSGEMPVKGLLNLPK